MGMGVTIDEHGVWVLVSLPLAVNRVMRHDFTWMIWV